MDKIQALESLKAFIGNKNDLINVIKSCNLLPNNSWNNWRDDFGNTILIKTDKTFVSAKKIYKISITDLFYKSDPKTIFNKSKQQLILYSSKKNNILIFFLGIDDRLRVLEYAAGWTTKVPLNYDVNFLIKVIKSLFYKLEKFQKFDKIWININDNREEMLLTNPIFKVILEELK